MLHQMGLTTQMPRERLLATNVAKECKRTDKKLGVTIRPPKVTVNAGNMEYLQMLDAMELLDKAPIDAKQPYTILARKIQEQNLRYGTLLALADRHYPQNTVMRLAHTASAGGISI